MGTITQKEIAEHLSISQTLVSKILSGRREARTPLHRKILAMSKETGYEPNHAAQSLRTGKQKAWHILLSSFGALADFNRTIIQGIAKVAGEQGFSISISTLNEMVGVDGFVRSLRGNRFDGVFILEDVRWIKQQLDEIAMLDMATIIVNCPLLDGRFSCVYSNGAEGIYEATRHLIEDCGRKKVSPFFYDDQTTLMDNRYEGFVQAHKDLGMRPGPVIRPPAYSTDLGYEGFSEAAAEIFRERIGEFDGIVCPCDYLAANTIGTLLDLGLKVPEDVSVVGFDDLPVASTVRPRLTTVACDGMEMGRQAARLMIEQISREDKIVKHIKVPTSLVVRQSSQRR